MFGLERPPRWGIFALVALVIANIGLFSYLLLRPDPPDPFAGAPAPTLSTSDSETVGPTSSTPAPTPGPSATAAQTSSPGPQVLAVYGDGYSSGSTLGGQGDSGWPALVAAQVGAELRLNAAALAGYAAIGASGLTFPQLATANPVADATVVVVFGSRNDEGEDPATVGAAAAQMYASIEAAAPDARLIVIGPAWSDARLPADLEAVRDAVEQAAAGAGATFVDPLAEGWFADPAGLIAADGISPLDAGHQYLAGLIAPTVQGALIAPR